MGKLLEKVQYVIMMNIALFMLGIQFILIGPDVEFLGWIGIDINPSIGLLIPIHFLNGVMCGTTFILIVPLLVNIIKKMNP